MKFNWIWTLILLFLSGTTTTLASPNGKWPGGDKIEVQQCDPWPCIYYYNDIQKLSNTYTHVREVNGVTVDIHITVVPKESYETIEVVPRDPQVRAEPSYAEVEDGEDVYINIIIPLY